MGKLADHWNAAAQGAMTTLEQISFKRFMLEWQIVFSAECTLPVDEDKQAELDDAVDLLSFQHFRDIDTAVLAFIQNRAGVDKSGKWLAYEQAFHELAALDWSDGGEPSFLVGDRGGQGVAVLNQVRHQDNPLSDWRAVLWNTGALADKRDPVGEANTRGIMEATLQAHFPDGPLAAGDCRVAYLRTANKGEMPHSTNSYRWACFESSMLEKLEAAHDMGLPVEAFFSEELSFAAYRQPKQAPDTAPQTPKIQQNKP